MAEQMEVPLQHIFSSIRRCGLIADADTGRGAGSLSFSEFFLLRFVSNMNIDRHMLPDE
jgi:hypothetical protein